MKFTPCGRGGPYVQFVCEDERRYDGLEVNRASDNTPSYCIFLGRADYAKRRIMRSVGR